MTKMEIRRISKLERRLNLYRKQNTKLIEKISDLLMNQKHYIENRMSKQKMLEKLTGKIQDFDKTRERMMDFLGSVSLPKGSQNPDRVIFVKLTPNEHKKLLEILAPHGYRINGKQETI